MDPRVLADRSRACQAEGQGRVTRRPTALYRLHSGAGVLLYIGITNDVRRRFSNHARRKAWWVDVDPARTRVEWLPCRDEAETAELQAIRDEKPLHNVITSDENGCARFLPSATGARWGRPKWQPSRSQALAVDVVVEMYQLKKQLEADYKALLAEVADPNRDDVPIKHLAERLGVERKTVYRHLGQSMK
ncbi:GIY-YIG nuclease family protein [Micromonospora sp. NPDC049891]|uniref:GIY-YIG nuclease family protein n=1 Tax=Micromonospora sp. NPDC049891 TaxID=3155655 RepID=UPI0033BFE9DA